MSEPTPCENSHKEGLPLNETSLTTPQTSEEELGCHHNTIKLYIDAYFEHVAPLPGNGFIHRAIFLRNWASGSVNPALLKAVCSASAVFVSTETTKQEQAERWRAEAEAYVWASIGRPSMVVLQILVVTISHSRISLQFPALQSLLAVAAKMAYILGLNHENESMSTAAREIRRRIMWSIFFSDRMLAAGQQDLISCPAESMHIQLPCNEKDFELAVSGKTGALICIPGEDDSLKMGLTAYTRRVIAEGSIVHDSRNELLQLEHNLQELHSSLPKSMAFDRSNLSLRAFSPLLQRYVMFHVMWHQCHCDLYRFMLPGIPDSLSDEVLEKTPPEYAFYCQRQAIQHAKKLVDLFQQVHKVGNQVVDSTIIICVYQCTQILIRSCYLGLLGSDQDGIEMLYQLMSATNVLSAVNDFSPVTNELVSLPLYFLEKTQVYANGSKTCSTDIFKEKSAGLSLKPPVRQMANPMKRRLAAQEGTGHRNTKYLMFLLAYGGTMPKEERKSCSIKPEALA
ncbi:hypothetical protein N7490_011676 [Penicillium lividum]|nr:hypothetical protein N7490_011676 [Penicillium lividum]